MGLRKIIAICLLVFFLLFIIVTAQQSDSDTMKLIVNLDFIEPIIKINVPNELYIGNITKGELGEWFNFSIESESNIKININDVSITNQDDNIFDNLNFKSCSSCSIQDINEFNFNISKPGSSGIEPKTLYVRLDLREYNGTLTEDKYALNASIKFIAVSAD